MALNKKINRYKHLIGDFKNWYTFIFYKIVGGDSITFKMRSGYQINVERRLTHTFKENFFDKVYLSHLGESFTQAKRPTVIDIGAQVGFFSLSILTQKPEAKVLAYEPMPANFKRLSEYKHEFEEFDWTLNHIAVAATNEPLVLYTNTLDGFSSRSSIFDKGDDKIKVEVPSITFDQIIAEHGLKKIDLLKLDCEGSEYPILYNMGEEQFKLVDNLCIESHQGQGADENHHTLVNYLRQYNYQVEEQNNGDGTGYIWAIR